MAKATIFASSPAATVTSPPVEATFRPEMVARFAASM